jgi:hypothetical protein
MKYLLNWENKSMTVLPLQTCARPLAIMSAGSSWSVVLSLGPNGWRTGQKLKFFSFLLKQKGCRPQRDFAPKVVSWLSEKSSSTRQLCLRGHQLR